MKKPSVTYRFFCTLTACVVLLGTIIPGAHADMLADLCDMDMSSMPGSDHCDLITHHDESGHSSVRADVDNDTEAEDCQLNFTCSCRIDEASRTSAVPVLSKTFTGLVQIAVETLDVSAPREPVYSSEQVFAGIYSPPIFLKNSSFLN